MKGDDINNMLLEHLARLDREEQTALIMGFLAEHSDTARKFVRYCASGIGDPDRIHPGWGSLLDVLERVESQERLENELERREDFLNELEVFRKYCLAGKCVQCADFEDKRRAYHDGDVYFEHFIYEFIEEHGDIQEFIRYAREADRYFRRGDHATAARAYGILLDIYRHDTGVEHLFVVDDDFPDLDLSEVEDVDAPNLMERRDACLDAMGSGRLSPEADCSAKDGRG